MPTSPLLWMRRWRREGDGDGKSSTRPDDPHHPSPVTTGFSNVSSVIPLGHQVCITDGAVIGHKVTSPRALLQTRVYTGSILSPPWNGFARPQD